MWEVWQYCAAPLAVLQYEEAGRRYPGTGRTGHEYSSTDTFSNCSALTSITLPDSLTSIDNGAFDGCPLDADSAAAVRAVRLSQAL